VHDRQSKGQDDPEAPRRDANLFEGVARSLARSRNFGGGKVDPTAPSQQREPVNQRRQERSKSDENPILSPSPLRTVQTGNLQDIPVAEKAKRNNEQSVNDLPLPDSTNQQIVEGRCNQEKNSA
jgi:hypothetical protein